MTDEKSCEENTEMLDYCSKRKISTFVLALIGFSVLVFFIEEFTEESEMKNEMEMKREYYNHENPKTAPVQTSTKYPMKDCWKHEKTEIISKCTKCREFEMNALKPAHCMETGYYHHINCTETHVVIMRACDVPKDARKNNFYIFSILNFIVLCASYMTATHRKEYLDQTAYNRLPSNF